MKILGSLYGQILLCLRCIDHSKSRNCLKLRNVIKLMYCYVNLRLLQKIDRKGAVDTVHLIDFLADAILDACEGGD